MFTINKYPFINENKIIFSLSETTSLEIFNSYVMKIFNKTNGTICDTNIFNYKKEREEREDNKVKLAKNIELEIGKLKFVKKENNLEEEKKNIRIIKKQPEKIKFQKPTDKVIFNNFTKKDETSKECDICKNIVLNNVEDCETCKLALKKKKMRLMSRC
jgi:hypothetical protein